MARISELSIENFQGISRRQKLSLGNFTLVFGENSAGKSSAARALLLMGQSLSNDRRRRGATGSPRFFSFVGSQVDLASFSNVVHRHDESLTITIGIRVELGITEGSSRPRFSPFRTGRTAEEDDHGAKVTLEDLAFEVSESCDSIQSLKLGFTFLFEGRREELTLDFGYGERVFLNSALETSREATRAFLGLRSEDEFSLEDLRDLEFSHNSLWPTLQGLMTQQETSMLRRKLMLSIDNWLRSARFFISTALASPAHVPGIRPIIDRVTFRDSADEESTRRKRIFKRLNTAENRYLGELTSGRYQIEHVTQNLGDAGFLGEVEVKLLRDTFLNVQVSFKDVGYGLGQILPVLSAMEELRFEAGNGLMIVEQPELHLHPKMQAELGQLMFEATLEGGQIIAETHSESMLLRVQKILRHQHEANLELSNVAVVYTAFDPECGTTYKNLELRSDMDFILDLPSSFSELRLSELS